MVTNLSMLLTTLRCTFFPLIILFTTATAQAHPGHDGHEEGDGFTWTLDHIVRYPGPTLLCVVGLCGSAWLLLHVVQTKRQSLKGGAGNSPTAETLS